MSTRTTAKRTTRLRCPHCSDRLLVWDRATGETVCAGCTGFRPADAPPQPPSAPPPCLCGRPDDTGNGYCRDCLDRWERDEQEANWRDAVAQVRDDFRPCTRKRAAA
jgi:hypothetical protein